MRSFPVRPALFLAAALLPTAIVCLWLLAHPSASDPEYAVQASAVAVVVSGVIHSVFPPADVQVYAIRLEIDELDAQSNDTFSETLAAVLADPNKSYARSGFRLPAGSGNDDMLDIFPDEAPDVVEEQRRLILIYAAASIYGCENDPCRRARLDELLGYFPGAVRYLPPQ